MRLHDIQFDFDRYKSKGQSQPILDVAVERLKECPEVRIVIGGHTDSVGTAAYNVDLSYQRAVATRDSGMAYPRNGRRHRRGTL